MKILKRIAILFIILLFYTNIFAAFGTTIHTGFETGILTSSEEKEILSNYATKRTNNNKTYEIRNDMGPLNIFSFNYSQLLITDQNGDTKIIYDINNSQIIKYIIIICIIISFFVFILIPTVYKLYKKGMEQHNVYDLHLR